MSTGTMLQPVISAESEIAEENFPRIFEMGGEWFFVHETRCRVCGKPEKIEIRGDKWMVEMAANSLHKETEGICADCKRRQEDDELRRRAALDLDAAAIRAGVPERFLSWDANIGNNALLQFFAMNLARWLYVCDRVDTGKTRAAARAIKMVIRQDPIARVRYWQASALASYYAGLCGMDCNRAWEFRQNLGRCKLLVIDDLGMRDKYSESFADLLYGVADSLYAEGGALWILSNRGMDKLAECLPGRVYDAIVSRFGRERNAGRYASWVRGVIDAGEADKV